VQATRCLCDRVASTILRFKVQCKTLTRHRDTDVPRRVWPWGGSYVYSTERKGKLCDRAASVQEHENPMPAASAPILKRFCCPQRTSQRTRIISIRSFVHYSHASIRQLFLCLAFIILGLFLCLAFICNCLFQGCSPGSCEAKDVEQDLLWQGPLLPLRDHENCFHCGLVLPREEVVSLWRVLARERCEQCIVSTTKLLAGGSLVARLFLIQIWLSSSSFPCLPLH